MADRLRGTLIGEGMAGEGPEIAHVDLVMGGRGGAVEQAFVSALASPSLGHAPILATIPPDTLVRPPTLVVNKITIKGAQQAAMIFEPAQVAVARAVVESVREGVIPGDGADDLLIIASIFVQSDARDRKRVFEYNYSATKIAIERAVTGKPTTREVLSMTGGEKRP